jgi:hypothetical protein
MAEFHIFGALVMGVIIGFIELVFVHSDEAGLGWFKHGLHALPVTFIFTFVGMNVPFVLNLIGWSWMQGPIATYGIPILIGLIAAFKVKSAAAITKGHGSVGEKLGHALIIGALIAISPFVWPFIEPMLPSFLQF